MNSRTGHAIGKTPQPGVKSGKFPTSWSCDAFKDSVEADGEPDSIKAADQCKYQEKNKLPPPKKKGYYLVMLVLTSNSSDIYDAGKGVYRVADYHWFRQDDNGLWSQKQGTHPAKNTDESNNLITNPETCNKTEKSGLHYVPGVGDVPEVLDYDGCHKYFYVKKGGASVQG